MFTPNLRPVLLDDETYNRRLREGSIRPYPGEWAYFSEVPAATVALDVRRAASAALAFGIRDLGLHPVTIRWFDLTPYGAPEYWFRSAVGRPVDGRVYGSIDGPNVVDHIRVRRGMTPAATASVVLHELVHVRDYADGAVREVEGDPEAEARARAYAAKHHDLAEAIGSPRRPNRAERRAARRKRAIDPSIRRS